MPFSSHLLFPPLSIFSVFYIGSLLIFYRSILFVHIFLFSFPLCASDHNASDFLSLYFDFNIFCGPPKSSIYLLHNLFYLFSSANRRLPRISFYSTIALIYHNALLWFAHDFSLSAHNRDILTSSLAFKKSFLRFYLL